MYLSLIYLRHFDEMKNNAAPLAISAILVMTVFRSKNFFATSPEDSFVKRKFHYLNHFDSMKFLVSGINKEIKITGCYR